MAGSGFVTIGYKVGGLAATIDYKVGGIAATISYNVGSLAATIGHKVGGLAATIGYEVGGIAALIGYNVVVSPCGPVVGCGLMACGRLGLRSCEYGHVTCGCYGLVTLWLSPLTS